MNALAPRKLTTALPVVDVSALAGDDAARRFAVGREIRAACLDKGFMYITGHGIPEATIEAAFAASRSFFSLPLAEKDALDMKHSFCNRGYEPIKRQTLEEGAPPDLKESFYLGPDLPLDDPRVVRGLFNHGPNRWPDLDGFRPAMEAYQAAVTALAARLLRGLALSLDLDEDFFEAFAHEPFVGLRLIRYPQQPSVALPDEKGCGAHTDFGGITVLAQDENSGLQVYDPVEGWVEAPPRPGSFVVNLGDFVARWTNDLYRSTLHRVVNLSGRERYSIATFFSGNAEYEVSCIPTCLAPGETPKYPPTTMNRHIAEMYRRTYVSGDA